MDFASVRFIFKDFFFIPVYILEQKKNLESQIQYSLMHAHTRSHTAVSVPIR